MCVGCRTISKLLALETYVCATSEVVVDYALFPVIKYAGVVGTMDAVAHRTVAVLVASRPEVSSQSDDAHLWVVYLLGPVNEKFTLALKAPCTFLTVLCMSPLNSQWNFKA